MSALKKQPAESRLYTMDFRNLCSGDEAIASVTSVTADLVTSPVLTIATATIPTARKIQFRVSGGLDGTTYHITARVVTDAGNTLEGDGDLKVEDL